MSEDRNFCVVSGTDCYYCAHYGPYTWDEAQNLIKGFKFVDREEDDEFSLDGETNTNTNRASNMSVAGNNGIISIRRIQSMGISWGGSKTDATSSDVSNKHYCLRSCEYPTHHCC